MKIIILISILFITLGANSASYNFDMSKRKVFDSFYGKFLLPEIFESLVTAASYDEIFAQLFGEGEEYITLRLSGTDYKYFTLTYDGLNSWEFKEATGLLLAEDEQELLTEDGEVIILE